LAKITLKDGSIFEGTIEELVELLVKVDGLGAANGDNFRKVEGREPRVGDYVKFFEDNLDITAGKYYEIINFDDDGDPEFIDDGGDVRYEFLIYLGKRFELFEKVGGEKSLKVGDYVVPLESADDKYYVTNTGMKLGKVVKELEGDYRDIKVEVIAHECGMEVGGIFHVESKYFRKATDEEVAQAKAEYERKQAEQKWAKIGRKPGEFKKGDIVRVVECTGAHEIGEIVELAEDGASEYLGNDGVVLVGEPEWFELIAPVESRVDIDD
jgi:hypothetical protein